MLAKITVSRVLDTHYPHGAGRVDFAQRSTWAISANEETGAEAGVLDVKIQADTVNTGSGMKNGKLKGIYPTLLKSALFAVVLACFKILEDAAIGRYHGRSFHQSIAELGGGTWTGTLTLTLLLFVVLIPLSDSASSNEYLAQKSWLGSFSTSTSWKTK